MIRVCLVDDHVLVRQGIRALVGVAKDIGIVGEAENGEQAVQLIAHEKPDVVLLDVRMPHGDGLSVLVAVRALPRPPAVIILTTFDDDEVLVQALRKGAAGYLLKDVSLEALLAAIRRVAAGENLGRPLPAPRVGDRLQRLRNEFASFAPLGKLSVRESEILRLIARGLSNGEIAAAVSLAEGTVKNHVSNILLKLGVRDRTQAALKAAEQGLI